MLSHHFKFNIAEVPRQHRLLKLPRHWEAPYLPSGTSCSGQNLFLMFLSNIDKITIREGIVILGLFYRSSQVEFEKYLKESFN
jgi:hypothetical protein